MRLPSPVLAVAGSEDVCRASAVLSPPVEGTLLSLPQRVVATERESRTKFPVAEPGGIGYVWGMKPFLLFALLAGALAVPLRADEKTQVAQIRKWYAGIEADKSLKVTRYRTGGEDEPHTATLTRYVDKDGSLKKLTLRAGGEHGVGTASYYFNAGKLFFVYDASESWYISGENESTDIGRQYRYYFHDGKCIRALGKSVTTKDGDKLRALMQKAKNEPIAHHDTAPKVLRKAMELSRITSSGALEKYFAGP